MDAPIQSKHRAGYPHEIVTCLGSAADWRTVTHQVDVDTPAQGKSTGGRLAVAPPSFHGDVRMIRSFLVAHRSPYPALAYSFFA
jgi:hypothetical protein